ncbi:hypothetical protein [Pseudomonas fildesensis]|nr:hypothetical protein [Pseudomonas fildesensis]
MSSPNAIKATINGKPVPDNSTFSTLFLLNVAVGEAYFRQGKRHRVLEKDWLLDAEGEVITIGLIIEEA